MLASLRVIRRVAQRSLRVNVFPRINMVPRMMMPRRSFATDAPPGNTTAATIEEVEEVYEEEEDMSEEEIAKYKMTKRGISINSPTGLYAHGLADACDMEDLPMRETYDNLVTFMEFARENPEIQVFIDDPSMSLQQKKDHLEAECYKEFGFDTITCQLIDMLLEDGKVHDLGDILVDFERLIDDALSEVGCAVTSAAALTPQQAEQVQNQILAIVKPGQSVRVEYVVDPSILGGLVVTVGDFVHDLSARSAIAWGEQNLREESY